MRKRTFLGNPVWVHCATLCLSELQGVEAKGSLGTGRYLSVRRSVLILSIARIKRGPSCLCIARCSARRRGTGFAPGDETKESLDRLEAEDMDNVGPEDCELGGEGDGDGGGESASERVSLGIEPKRAC